LCIDLNEESAHRNDEAIALREDLKFVKMERDAMAEEISRLRAEVQCQEKERAEYAETKKKLIEYEIRGLDRTDDAIQSRDRIISDLSSKLEESLDLLEVERAQQRHRRHIIFPEVGPPPTSCPSQKPECQ
jgi:septation ring formation regulator EzrA